MERFDKQQELLEKYRNGLCTPQEKAVVEHWYNTQSASLKDNLPDPLYASAKDEIWQSISKKIEQADDEPKKPTSSSATKRILVAASIFISLGAGVFYFASDEFPGAKESVVSNHQPIKPGGNKAYLTLSNGKRILLSDSTSGTLALQSGVEITKTADGQLIYKITGDAAADSGKYNILEAPRGGQYQIVLIDGTRVWLNSASVLKYPARFSASERRVELTGEAYFQVTKNKKQPFRIITGDQEIEVLGTQFNVNGYKDESAIKTTLIEGSVSVTALPSSRQSAATRDLSSGGKDLSRRRDDGRNEARTDVILKPGQQSILQAGSLNVDKVDTEEAIAWKDGYFIFENDNTDAIMRKLERWYDIDVVDQGKKASETKVMGAINKNTDLPEVLKLLEETGKFKFKTEGRRVTIMQ